MKFSANLGFLWADMPLPQAIRAAAAAGFDAVECHWPYDTPVEAVRAALAETGLRLLGLNTRRGAPGEHGLAALPGREAEAQAATEEALAYASATGARHIHVMAGMAEGALAHAAFCAALRHASAAATPHGLTILIEPLNHHDAPGYFLRTTAQAATILHELALPNLRLMFDCYHVQIMEGDLTRRLTALMPLIGHIQFAAVPDRGPPGRGEVDYAHVFAHIAALGYRGFLGAEYRPAGDTAVSLGWLRALRGGTVDAMVPPERLELPTP